MTNLKKFRNAILESKVEWSTTPVCVTQTHKLMKDTIITIKSRISCCFSLDRGMQEEFMILSQMSEYLHDIIE